MGTRITSRGLAQAVLVARQAEPGVAITFTANAVSGNKALKFYGVVKVGVTDYDLAGPNGKLRLFTDIDDFIKFVAGSIPAGSGDYSVTIKTGTVLAAAVPTDLVKAAAAKVIKLQAAKVAQTGVLADIDAQIALMAGWENGSPLQVAKLAEAQTQRASVVVDMAAIDAEIVRLTP